MKDQEPLINPAKLSDIMIENTTAAVNNAAESICCFCCLALMPNHNNAVMTIKHIITTRDTNAPFSFLLPVPALVPTWVPIRAPVLALNLALAPTRVPVLALILALAPPTLTLVPSTLALAPVA